MVSNKTRTLPRLLLQNPIHGSSTAFVQSARNRSQPIPMINPLALSTPLAPTRRNLILSSKCLLSFSQQKLRTRKCVTYIWCLLFWKTQTNHSSQIWYWTPKRSQPETRPKYYRSATTSHPALTGTLQRYSMHWYRYHQYWKCHHHFSPKHTKDLHNGYRYQISYQRTTTPPWSLHQTGCHWNRNFGSLILHAQIHQPETKQKCRLHITWTQKTCFHSQFLYLWQTSQPTNLVFHSSFSRGSWHATNNPASWSTWSPPRHLSIITGTPTQSPPFLEHSP